jgi:sugar phosphate isomerase/epimerase
MTTQVFVSTGGQRGMAPARAARAFAEAGIAAVELSGGEFQPNLRGALAELKRICTLQFHNYFPPPSEPFVLNLATADPALAEKCLGMASECIRLAADLGTPRYSVHAGFRLDLGTRDLGRKVGRKALLDAEEASGRFLERLGILADLGRELGVEILVENNVLTAENYREFGENPFLAVTPEDVETLMRSAPANVSFLLDVAHWKVSARTLGREPAEMFARCGRWLGGSHLSENDGTADSNEPVRADSWFWEHLPKDLPFHTLEVYGAPPSELKAQADLAAEMLAC